MVGAGLEDYPNDANASFIGFTLHLVLILDTDVLINFLALFNWGTFIPTCMKMSIMEAQSLPCWLLLLMPLRTIKYLSSQILDAGKETATSAT
jgi:hypothetical protein